jgi:SagB-type dehydrogenase family enzyme
MMPAMDARRFHVATKHTRRETVGGRMIPLGAARRPPQFKGYAGGDVLPFADRPAPLTEPALAALTGARTAAREMPARADVEWLCHLANGVLRWRPAAGPAEAAFGFRAAPCTGALYHIELYVACADLDGLPAGLYHHDARTAGLRRLLVGDQRGLLVEAAAREPAVAEAPAIVVMTSAFWRNAWKYGSRAYRHSYWDGGVVLANVLAVANALGLPARVVLGFADGEIDRLLELHSEREAPIALVALGTGGPTAPAATSAALLAREDEPLFPLAEFFPAILAAHAATSLASAGDVTAWRAAAPARLVPAAGVATDAGPGIEAAIVGRRSTRRFARVPITAGQLRALLDCTLAPIPADVELDAGLVHLIVAAVEGMEPGLYRVEAGRPVLLRAAAADDLRRAAARVALGQELGADAAVHVCFFADLDDVQGRLGDRGWRAAHMGSAIAAGRLEVAAQALGLGATGLTFYDDELASLFGLDGRRMAVTYLAAAGVPQGRRTIQ